MTETADPLRQAEAHAYQRRRRRLSLAANAVELTTLITIITTTKNISD